MPLIARQLDLHDLRVLDIGESRSKTLQIEARNRVVATFRLRIHTTIVPESSAAPQWDRTSSVVAADSLYQR